MFLWQVFPGALKECPSIPELEARAISLKVGPFLVADVRQFISKGCHQVALCHMTQIGGDQGQLW